MTSADKDAIYQQTRCEITTRGRTRKDGRGNSWTDGRNLQVHGPINTMEHALHMAWQAIERNGKGKGKRGHGKGCGNGKGGSGEGPDLQKGQRSTKGVDSTTVNDNQAVPPAPPAVSPPPGLEPLVPVLPLDVAIAEALQGNAIHVASNSREATVVEAIRTASWRGYHAGACILIGLRRIADGPPPLFPPHRRMVDIYGIGFFDSEKMTFLGFSLRWISLF